LLGYDVIGAGESTWLAVISASIGPFLARRRRVCACGRLTSATRMPGERSSRTRPAGMGARGLDPDDRDRAERL
jgi:hypothetical protein